MRRITERYWVIRKFYIFDSTALSYFGREGRKNAWLYDRAFAVHFKTKEAAFKRLNANFHHKDIRVVRVTRGFRGLYE